MSSIRSRQWLFVCGNEERQKQWSADKSNNQHSIVGSHFLSNNFNREKKKKSVENISANLKHTREPISPASCHFFLLHRPSDDNKQRKTKTNIILRHRPAPIHQKRSNRSNMEDPPGFSGSKPSPVVPARKIKAAEITTPQKQQQQHQQNPSPERNQQQQVSAKDRKETEAKIEKLLTRLQRQFSAQRPSEQQQKQSSISFVVPPRPPDQAASLLGRELADAFLQSLNNNNTDAVVHQKVLASLKQRGIHPSIPHAFFTQLIASISNQNNSHNGWDDWLPNFILECERTILEELPNMGGSASEEAEVSGANETLSAAVRAFSISSGLRAVVAEPQHGSNNNHKQYHEIINTTYRRLQSSAARTLLLREFSRAVKDLQYIPTHLSPLLASCVLTVWATPHAEKTLLLQGLWRQCWDVIYASSDLSDQFWDHLFWQTEALYIMLLVLPSAGRLNRDDRPAWRELAQCWLMELGDMIAFVVHATTTDDDSNTNNNNNNSKHKHSISLHSKRSNRSNSNKHGSSMSSERMLAEWLQLVLNKLLPILATQGAGSYRLSLEPFLEQLNGLIVEMDDSLIQLNTMVVFRLSTMALSTPLTGETRSILTLFSYLLPSESAFARGLTSTVGAVFLQEESCQNEAKHLLKTSQGMDQQLMGLSDRGKTYSVIQLLEEGEDGDEVLKFIASVDVSALESLSAVKQIEVLLLGISMMEIAGNEELQTAGRNFIKCFLQKYSHLGLLLMPSLIADINAAAVEKSPSELLTKLHFLVDSVTADPSCAQQAWNLIGVQMLDPNNPVVLRVTIIRLLPRLCVANKRLYRRVMDTLGTHRDGKPSSGTTNTGALSPASMAIQTVNADVRLAFAASLCDLAKDDLIRDTSDCIDWIQELLVEDYSDSPSNALLVHYAIMTLHYLVVAQELDFSLVLKVLKKKLCSVTNIEDVRHLPPVIQESLALLLGDGECKDDSSSEDDEEGGGEPKTPVISAQVVGAVQTLIDLGFQYETVKPNAEASVELIARIRRNVYFSLSKYSLDVLGLDEDGIKAGISWQEQGDQRGESPPQVASRYVSLRKLAATGIQLPAGIRGMVEDFETILGDFNSKILRFEEEALSAALWATKGTRNVHQRRGEAGKSGPKENVSLPAPSKLQTLYKRMPSASSSIARMMCFEGKTFSKFLSLAAEVSFEEKDPYTLVFIVQAWLNSTSRLLSQLFDGIRVRALTQTLEEIRRWGQHTGNNDAMYLTMAALTVYIPRIEDTHENHAADHIQMEVFSAFKSLQFMNADIGKVSLAITAISSLRGGHHERVSEIISALEQTVKGYGGHISFGAAYGMAMIAEAISQMGRAPALSGDNRMMKTKIGQVAGFLVDELVVCTEEATSRSDVLTTLIACLQSGVATPGLANSLADSVSQQFSVIPAKAETAKYLFIAMGICLPSLSQVNGDLLLGTLFLLERCPWGSGKGPALVPVLVEAKATGVLTGDEYNVIVTEYARVFDQGANSNETGHSNEDLFYVLNGTSNKPSPHMIRQFLTQSSHSFDNDRVISPLIGAAVAICSFPCLGFGSKDFSAPAQLRQQIPSATADSVIEVLAGALDQHTDYSSQDYSKTAVMLMGLLASLKNQPSDIISLAPTKEKTVSHATSRLKSLNIDFALLPTAQQGTLLSDMIYLIQDAHKGHTADMMRFVCCLEPLSLPGHFAKHFLEPLISEDNERTKEGCISLLSAQICGRRKAVFEGKDFTNLALQICIMPLVSFNALLGSGQASLKFVKCLEGVIRSLPTELVENGASNLWEICLSLSTDEPDLLVRFLNSILTILKEHASKKKHSSLSPKTMTFLEEFVATRIFSELRELSWGASIGENNAAEEGAILRAYVACLTALPLASLEQFDVFVFLDDDSFSGEVLRALVILQLVKNRYFKDSARAMREFSKVLSWFSRKYVAPGAELYMETLRRIACALAAATSVFSVSEKREILLSMLEQLLLCQATAAVVGLDLLSVMVASWCSDVATDGDLSMVYICTHSTDNLQSLSDTALSQVFAFFRHDLPYNLSSFGRREKIGAIISNQIWRIYSTWTRHGADEEVLVCLKKTFLCDSDSKEDDFISLTSTILSAARTSSGVGGRLSSN